MRRPSSVGVDISDSSIKVLQLDAVGNIVAYGNIPLKEGVVQAGYINDKALFAEALIEVLKNTKPVALFAKQTLLRAVLCLPEAKLFTHQTVLPKGIKNADVEAFIHNDAKKIVPFDFDDLYWDYHVSEKNTERYVTFVGAPRAIVDNYVEALTFAGIKPASIVGELFSLAQAISSDGPVTRNYIIVDIGAHTTNIGTFFIDTVASMSVTVPFGGEYLTESLVEKLQMSREEAEESKRKNGVDKASTETAVSETLKHALKETIKALKEAKVYFETTTSEPVSYLVLAGGTALLPGLARYLSDELGIEVRIADPFLKIKNREIIKTDNHGIFFSNVIGLALQSRTERTTSFNLLTQYRYSDDQEKRETLPLRDIQSFADLKYVLFLYFTTVRNFIRALAQFVTVHFKPKLVLVSLFVAGTIAFLGWVVVTYI